MRRQVSYHPCVAKRYGRKAPFGAGPDRFACLRWWSQESPLLNFLMEGNSRWDRKRSVTATRARTSFDGITPTDSVRVQSVGFEMASAVQELPNRSWLLTEGRQRMLWWATKKHPTSVIMVVRVVIVWNKPFIERPYPIIELDVRRCYTCGVWRKQSTNWSSIFWSI